MLQEQLNSLIKYLRRKESAKYNHLLPPKIPKNYPYKNQTIDIALMETDLNDLLSIIMAMSNTNGGVIIVGGKKIYLKTPNEYITKLNDMISLVTPKPNYSSYIHKYKDRYMIIVTVSKLELLITPCHYITRPPSTALLRYQGRNIKIPSSYIHALNNIKENGNKDECIVQKKYNVKYTDNKLLSILLNNYNKIHKQIELNKNEIKSFLNFDTRSHTLGYIMSLSLYPQIYYPYLYINIEIESTGEIEIIDGSISHMLKYALFYIKKHIGYKLIVTKRNIYRIDSIFHLGILSELIYNALIHRDYSYYYHANPIEILIKENSILIKNNAYAFLDINEFINGKKLIRNNYIKLINDTILYKEFPHHGFKYINRAAKLSNTPFPTIKCEDDVFTVELFCMQLSKYKKPYTINDILLFCAEPKTKLEIYNHFFGCTKKNYKYFYRKYIWNLIEAGVLEFLIPDKPKSKFQKLKSNIDFLNCIK